MDEVWMWGGVPLVHSYAHDAPNSNPQFHGIPVPNSDITVGFTSIVLAGGA
jgi:hypothetical protein